MKLFLDCEFTDYKGDLMSIGLVSEDGDEFYYVVEHGDPNQWVKDNVVPFLNGKPVELRKMQYELEGFLSKYDSIEVIADWPEDISYFCNALITAPGERINTPQLTMKVYRNINGDTSKIPHNALEDAKAIKESYFSQYN